MQSYKDKILKSGKSILSILLAVLLINQGIVAEAASGAQTATPNEKTASAEAQKPQKTEITETLSIAEGHLTITWKEVESSGYELALSKDENFNEENTQIYTYDNEQSKVILEDLDYDATYYYKVRAFNEVNGEKIYADWSDISSHVVNGHKYLWYQEKAPTCTENGLEYEKCDNCYKKTGETRTIPALGHTYEWVKDGQTWYNKCQRCGYVKETKAVIIKPQSLTLNTVKQTIGVKGTCKISVKKATSQNADKSVRYQSKNTKIATVNSKGIVTGKKLGKTKIVVTAMQNKKLRKYVTIEVKKLKPTKLTLNAKNVKIKYGDKYQLVAKVRPQNMYCPVVFFSNNKKVATIDKNGVIRGKKAGTATITARTKYKNKKGKYLYKKCTVKISHNYKLVKSAKPTCEKAGYKKYKCDCCNKISTTKLKATGHKWKTLEEIKPTCENSGQKKEECSNCHKVKTTKLKATGHDYSIIIEKKEATDDEDGYLIAKCKVCGKTNRQTLTKDRTYTIDLGNGKTTTVVGHYEREMEEEMFNAVNQYRREKGLPELGQGFYKLKNAADIRAYEISYYFEHTRPNGERALDSFSKTCCCCGENIARGQLTVEKAMNDFKNSNTHNAVMLAKLPKFLSVSIFAEYQYTVNGKKQYKLHYVQFYGIKPFSFLL